MTARSERLTSAQAKKLADRERLTDAEIKKLVDYDDSFLRCRTYGHSWKEVSCTKKTTDNVIGVANLILSCASCKARRYDEISMLSGMVISRFYDYPEDYLRVGRTPRQEFRLALVKKHIKPSNVPSKRTQQKARTRK